MASVRPIDQQEINSLLMIVEIPIPKYIPAYNNRYVVLDSANNEKPRFRYVVQIMDGSTELARIDTPPNIDGKGVIELSNILKNFIDLEPNMLITLSDDGGKHFFKYSLRYGEMYVDEWTANDFIFVDGNIGLTTDGFTDDEHDYNIGDLINVDSADEDFVLSGVYRIIDIPDNKTVVINQPWITSGTEFDISTQYTDQRATDFLNLASQSDRYVFDSRIGFNLNANYNENVFKISPSNGRLLTALSTENVIPVYEGDRFTSNYFGTLTGDLRLVVERLNEEPISVVLNITPHKGTVRIDFDALKTAVGLSVGDKYTVRLRDFDTFAETPRITFIVKELCTKFENKKLVWLDGMGGWNSFNFELHSTKDINVNRTVFERENIGKLTSSGYEVDTAQFGDVVTKVNSKEVFTVNSNRLTQAQIFLLEDLFKSRYVYELNGSELTPIVLLTNDYKVSSLLHDRMRTVTVQYRHSNVEVR